MTRGLRNNNPGNIRHSPTLWQGEIRPSRDAAFKQFASMAHGYRAMLKLLQNYSRLHGCRTPAAMIARWAPPNENDTQRYIDTVCRLSGLPANSPIDVAHRDTLCRLAAAMSYVENGVRAVTADVLAGWNLL